MEAGGFEPPSRDISGQASTCLVAFLKFARDTAKRQALSLAISQSVSPLRHEHPQRLARCLTPYPNAQAKSGRTGRRLGSHSQLIVAN